MTTPLPTRHCNDTLGQELNCWLAKASRLLPAGPGLRQQVVLVTTWASQVSGPCDDKAWPLDRCMLSMERQESNDRQGRRPTSNTCCSTLSVGSAKCPSNRHGCY